MAPVWSVPLEELETDPSPLVTPGRRLKARVGSAGGGFLLATAFLLCRARVALFPARGGRARQGAVSGRKERATVLCGLRSGAAVG